LIDSLALYDQCIPISNCSPQQEGVDRGSSLGQDKLLH
jgi:hypothetical protein